MIDCIHVKTSAGRLAVRLSTGRRTPLLLIHGNSMSSQAFEPLLEGPIGRSYRLIAVDLPGHGESDKPAFPDKAYTVPGYADAMLDVLFALDVPEAALCGWSLGGHIALEMMIRSPATPGAFVVAAPPVTPGPAAIEGFNVTDSLGLFITEDLGPAEKRLLAEASMGAPAPDFAYRAVERTDGRARRIVVESLMSGVGGDPQTLFRDPSRPVAVVMGEHDAFASPDFMRTVRGPGVWRGGALTIPGAGHAPFHDAPGAFNALLLDFLREVSASRRSQPSAAEAEPERLTA